MLVLLACLLIAGALSSLWIALLRRLALSQPNRYSAAPAGVSRGRWKTQSRSDQMPLPSRMRPPVAGIRLMPSLRWPSDLKKYTCWSSGDQNG